MPHTKTITLYEFDELSDKAKERARDWYRSCRDSNDFEYVIADAVRMGEIIGIEFATHEVKLMNGNTRRDPSVWWSVGYCQSDGACFDGAYRYAKQSPAKIRAEAPEDTELHRIADDLRDIQKRYNYSLTASVRARDLWPETEVNREIGPNEISGDDVTAVKELMRDFCRWIYKQLRTEDEYQSADEQVDENIRANEYDFDEHGDRA